jgi:hypothetical protein
MGRRRNRDRAAASLALDAALVVGFLVALRPFLTGIAVHEWLGLAVGAGVAAHAALHRRWLAGVTRRLRGRCPMRTRLYWVLDTALGLGFVAILISGVAISRVTLPGLAASASDAFAWVVAHRHRLLRHAGSLGAKLALHGVRWPTPWGGWRTAGHPHLLP